MDERYITKYMDEARKFMSSLEENEKRILNLSTNDYDQDANLTDEAIKIVSTSYDEYISDPSNDFMTEDAFNELKAHYEGVLNQDATLMSVDGNVVSTTLQPEYENMVDEVTNEIKADIDRQKKIIPNVINAIKAQIAVMEDELEDTLSALRKTDNKDEKVKLNVQFNELKNSIDIAKQAMSDMKNYLNFVNSVAKEYDVSEPKYSASIDFAEKMADIMTTIDYLQDRVDRVDYNQFTMDIVFDETTNTYKVNCRCGNIVLSPASTFTKEQITPDALQGILYRFSEKVAANSPLSMDEIRKRDISCKLDGQEICKTKFDNVGLLLANGINDALIQNSGTSEPTPGTPEPTPGTPEQAPGTPEPTPGTPEPTPGTPEPTPGTPEPTPGTPEPTPGTSEPTPGTPEPTPGTPEPTSGTPEQAPGTPEPTSSADNGVTVDLKNVMKHAKRVKSSRRMRARKISVGCFTAAVAAVGLSFIPPLMPVSATLLTIGGATGVAGITSTLYDAVVDLVGNMDYKATCHQLNKIAKKVTKAFNKDNKKSGIKFEVRGNQETGELRFAIVKDGEDVALIDSRSTGVIIDDDYSLNQNEVQDVVKMFQDELDKKFKKFNDEKKRGNFQKKFGIPKVTVDNLPVLFTEFGGYNFNLEGNQFGMMDSSKVEEEEKEGRGIGAIFRKFREKIRLGKKKTNNTIEEDLDDVASRNTTNGDSADIGNAVSEEELEGAVGVPEVQMPVEQQVVEEPPVIETPIPLGENPETPVSEEDQMNDVRRANISQVLSQLPLGEQHEAFVDDVMSLNEAEFNRFAQEVSTNGVSDADDLRTIINNARMMNQGQGREI